MDETAVAEKAKFDALTRNFIAVVIQNRRLFVLSDIIFAFRNLLSKYRGEVTAEVVSASELSKKQLTALENSLKKAIGSRVTIDASVNPELIGGLVVKVDSRLIDSTLRTKLQQMKLAMIGIG